MYSRYEKFKKWIAQPPLSSPVSKYGVVLKINKAARIIHKNDFPIGAAAALNEGVPTGLHLEELVAQVLDPARRRGSEKEETLLSLGASSLLGPPEDLSTVEELQARFRRLPLHPTTTVSVWTCTVAAAEVMPSTGRSLQTFRPQPHSSHSRCRFGCSPKIPTKNKCPLVDRLVSGEKVIFLFPFRLCRLLNRYRLRSFPNSDCLRRCPPLRRCRRLRRRVFWPPAPLLLLLLWISCL